MFLTGLAGVLHNGYPRWLRASFWSDCSQLLMASCTVSAAAGESPSFMYKADMSKIEISIRPGRRPIDELLEQRQSQLKTTSEESFQDAGLSKMRELYGNPATVSGLPQFDGFPHSVDQIRQSREMRAALLPEVVQQGDRIARLDHSKLEANHLFESMVMRRFAAPDCGLDYSVLPDGTVKSVYTTAEGSIRTKISRPDGTSGDEVCDRFGRKLLVRESRKDGSWTKEENQYQDSRDKMSPFLASKKIIDSNGNVTEQTYNWHGGIAKTIEHKAETQA